MTTTVHVLYRLADSTPSWWLAPGIVYLCTLGTDSAESNRRVLAYWGCWHMHTCAMTIIIGIKIKLLGSVMLCVLLVNQSSYLADESHTNLIVKLQAFSMLC